MTIHWLKLKYLLIQWLKKWSMCICMWINFQSLKTYQAFEKYSIGVKLANPLKTKAIAQARIKTDTLDARTLAHLLKSDLVAECAEVNGVEALLVDKAGNVQGTLSGGNFTCAIGRVSLQHLPVVTSCLCLCSPSSKLYRFWTRDNHAW